MVNIVRILAKDYDHVRVDLYYIKGKIYFGELTFTNGGGYEKLESWEMDLRQIQKGEPVRVHGQEVRNNDLHVP